MCTAISYKSKDHYFGRNLDLDYFYEESVVITPRKYPFYFRKEPVMEKHYAMMGMAFVHSDYPLYYDAVNEKGLGMASLHFPGNAVYQEAKNEMYNITPFELIPWVLGQCASVQEARDLLEKTNILHESFAKELPLSPLHFILADKEKSIVAEPMEDGLRIMENPIRVLTNNPPFPYHLMRINDFMGLTNQDPHNTFAPKLRMEACSRGMGAIGLPGDLSSASRFVRAAFAKWNAIEGKDETENVHQFFHILESVKMIKGCVEAENGVYDYTIYTSCCNADKGIYYYKTYQNSEITAVDLYRENLEGRRLVSYPMRTKADIYWQN